MPNSVRRWNVATATLGMASAVAVVTVGTSYAIHKWTEAWRKKPSSCLPPALLLPSASISPSHSAISATQQIQHVPRRPLCSSPCPPPALLLPSSCPPPALPLPSPVLSSLLLC
ncbi:unnamed protein product [Closterium sp. Naga37s-1]|nr:unnamed protein product [Closterium sp. Naga37s-1]